MPSATASKPSLTRRGTAWAKALDASYALLWFEYLKVSPSYELARRFRAGSWTALDEARKPADFDAVLTLYDDLGDVRSLLFKEWWLATAIDFFGYRGSTPRITRLGTARPGKGNDIEKLAANAEKYLSQHWKTQGEPTTMLLAIPVGLPKAQIIKQVATWLDEYPEAKTKAVSTPPKYRLVSRKLDHKSLFKYLNCVWIRAREPKTALWRIGVRAEVSSTYSGRLEATAKLDRHQQTEDRTALKIYTSRAIARGLLIAENAARGQFPTYTPNKHAVAPDWNDLQAAVKLRVQLDLRSQSAG